MRNRQPAEENACVPEMSKPELERFRDAMKWGKPQEHTKALKVHFYVFISEQKGF